MGDSLAIPGRWINRLNSREFASSASIRVLVILIGFHVVVSRGGLQWWSRVGSSKRTTPPRSYPQVGRCFRAGARARDCLYTKLYRHDRRPRIRPLSRRPVPSGCLLFGIRPCPFHSFIFSLYRFRCSLPFWVCSALFRSWSSHFNSFLSCRYVCSRKLIPKKVARPVVDSL